MRMMLFASVAAVLGGCIPGGGGGYDDRLPPPPPPEQRYPAPRINRYPPPDQYPQQPDRDEQPRDEDDVTALPAPRPAWEARPVNADAVEVAAQVYTVEPGDTLNRIAAKTQTSADLIGRQNGFPSTDALRIGDRIQIPGGRFHLVRAGQSGIAIARAYGVPWAKIVDANGLVEPYILRTGQRVLIPGGGSSPSSAAQRAAAFRLNIDDILTGGEPALARNTKPVESVPGPTRVLPASAVVVPPARFAGGGFSWPVQGRVIGRFGPGQSGERRNGITIAAPLDTPIRAAADGVVAYVGSGIASLGGLVIVKHGGNWTTVYGYAAKLLVQRGQAVKRGQTVALSGETGSVERPAVHFELRKGRTPVNPEDQLPRS